MLWLVGRWLVMLTATLMAGAGSSACRMSGPMVVDGSVGKADRPLDADATRETRPQPYLLIRLRERRLYLLDDAPGTPDESFPIAVGREGLETPVGLFQVEEMVENPDFDKVASGVVVEDDVDRGDVQRAAGVRPDLRVLATRADQQHVDVIRPRMRSAGDRHVQVGDVP